MIPKMRALVLAYAVFDQDDSPEGLFMAGLAGYRLNLALICPDEDSFTLSWGDIPGIEAVFREAFGPPARIEAG